MFAVNKDYNSYFKVVKPEVELSFEGYADASKVAAILMRQGYVVTMYRDDPGMDVYCIYATYVGENGYEFERMAAFIDTSTEMAGLRQHDDVFPDDAEQLDDEDDSDSDNNPEKWDADAKSKDGNYYYDSGYSDGQFDYKNENNYDNSKFDNDEYIRGYDDGWDDAEGVELDDEEEDEEVKDDDHNYYGLGYAHGKSDYECGLKYSDTLYDLNAYTIGYADGWHDAEVDDATKSDENEKELYNYR